MANDEPLSEMKEAGEAIGKLAEDEQAFTRAVEAFEKRDADAFRKALESRQLLAHCTRICLWLCTWRCFRICRLVCKDMPTEAPTPAELQRFARALVPLRDNPDLLKRLVAAIDQGNADDFGAIVKELKLQRFCFLLCHWICLVRCRQFCLFLCAPQERPPDIGPLDDIRDTAEALVKLAEDETTFTRALDSFRKRDAREFQMLLERLQLLRFCILICRWFCTWNCFRICLVLCRELPTRDLTIPELREFALRLPPLVRDEAQLKRLLDAFMREDVDTFGRIVSELKLGPFCFYLCHWICLIHCDVFCRIFCPPGCLPIFRYIGVYNFLTQVNSTPAGNGMTSADSRAFFRTIRLRGNLCKKHSGGPAEYRFEIRELPMGAWTPVPADFIEYALLGIWKGNPVNPADPDVMNYTIKGSAPAEKVAALSADGWVQVPQEDFGDSTPGGTFYHWGDLIALNTEKIVAWTDISIAGVTAGQSTAPAGPGDDRFFGIRMRVRRVGQPATEIGAGECEKLAIYNRKYDDVTHKGSWATQIDPDQLGVVMLDITEIGGGCAKITNTLTIKYTAAHPNLGTVAITMDGPGGPYGTTLADDLGSTASNRFGTASVILPSGTEIKDLDKCAYLVKLSAQLLLTTGDSVPDLIWDEVAFCK